MNPAIPTLILAAVALGAADSASAQYARNAASIGAGLHPLGTAGPVIQYENLLSPSLSLGGRLLAMEYTYDDGSYHETGDGIGGEFLVSYHFRNQGFLGPYVTVALGYFDSDWEWKDPYSSGATGGRGSTKGAEASASFGWRFALGRNFYLDPSITVGNFFGRGKDSTGSRESEMGVYGAVLLKVGLTF